MPRTIWQDPEIKAAERIFGKKTQPVNLSEVSRRTGITVATLSRRRKRPALMSLGEFAKIAKVTGKTDEEIVQIVRGLM